MVTSSNAAQPSSPRNDEHFPQRAKRIPRPAAWGSMQKLAAPKPQRAQTLQQPFIAAEAPATPSPDNAVVAATLPWRSDPSFIMRVCATLGVMNLLLFTLFPASNMQLPQSETVLSISDRSMLPNQLRSNQQRPTLYAPAPSRETVRANNTGAPSALDAPRWVRVPGRQ